MKAKKLNKYGWSKIQTLKMEKLMMIKSATKPQ